jgi:hypothetical protein
MQVLDQNHSVLVLQNFQFHIKDFHINAKNWSKIDTFQNGLKKNKATYFLNSFCLCN